MFKRTTLMGAVLAAVLTVAACSGADPTATPPPPTDTPAPPATAVPPTDTPVPPTSTPVPPTDTPVPPTATPAPSTATPVPPTATPVPPTVTPGGQPSTPIQPTAAPATSGSAIEAYAQQCEMDVAVQFINSLASFEGDPIALDPTGTLTWGRLAELLDGAVQNFSQLTPPAELQEYHDARLASFIAFRDSALSRPSGGLFIQDFLLVIQEILPQVLEISLDPDKTDEQKERLIEEFALEKIGEFFGPEWVETAQAEQEALEALPEETRAILERYDCLSV